MEQGHIKIRKLLKRFAPCVRGHKRIS